MPTQKEYTQMLQEVTTYIDAIDVAVQEQIEGQTDSGEPVSGYSCQYGKHSISVIGCPIWEFFQIRYSFNLAQLLAVQQAGVETSQGQVTITQADIQHAQQDLVDRLSDDEHAELRLELLKQLSNSSSAIALTADDENRVVGVQLTSNIFVYEEEFGVGDFHEAVQRTVNLGWQGKEILIHGYAIRGELEAVGSGVTDVDDDLGPTAFQ